MFKKWELALMAGLLAGLLISPVRAESLPISRWQTRQSPAAEQYQVSLFPFAVGTKSEPVISKENQRVQPEIQVRFRLVELWEQIRSAIDP